MDHEKHLRRAIHLAADHSADGEHGPFGAVVVLDGAAVGEGWNQVVAGNDPTAHAEVMAIREACRRLDTHDLSGAVIYCSCEPCPMCLSAIYWARISEVFFAASAGDAASAGFDDSLILEELKVPWAERKIRGNRALADEGRGVLEGWARNPRRKPY